MQKSRTIEKYLRKKMKQKEYLKLRSIVKLK